MAHNSLLRNVLQVARRMGSINIYPRCGKELETSFHALRYCDKITHIWLQLIHPKFQARFFKTDLKSWLLINLNIDLSRLKDGSQKLFFGLACRMIQLQPNEVVFNNGSLKAPKLITNLFSQANEILMVIGILNESSMLKASKVEVFNKWKRPEIGWIKLKFNSTCSNEGNAMATRGVLRDQSGT